MESAYISVDSYAFFLGRLFLGIFFIFVAMVKGIVSLTSISEFSFLVYSNTRNVCAFISYLGNFLNSLIHYCNFLIAYFGVSLYSIMFSAKSGSFTSFFPNQIHFIFSSMITVVKTSRTMLNNSGESGTLTFFLILEEIFSLFHH